MSQEELKEELAKTQKRNRELQLAIENVRTVVEVVRIHKRYREEILKCLPEKEEELECEVSSVESVQLLWD